MRTREQGCGTWSRTSRRRPGRKGREGRRGAGEFDRGGRRGDPAVRDLLSRFTIGNVDFEDAFGVEVIVDYLED